MSPVPQKVALTQCACSELLRHNRHRGYGHAKTTYISIQVRRDKNCRQIYGRHRNSKLKSEVFVSGKTRPNRFVYNSARARPSRVTASLGCSRNQTRRVMPRTPHFGRAVGGFPTWQMANSVFVGGVRRGGRHRNSGEQCPGGATLPELCAAAAQRDRIFSRWPPLHTDTLTQCLILIKHAAIHDGNMHSSAT